MTAESAQPHLHQDNMASLPSTAAADAGESQLAYAPSEILRAYLVRSHDIAFIADAALALM